MSKTEDNNSGCAEPEFPESLRRKIRSFVKREGRMSKRQTQAYKKLLPKYGISFNNQTIDITPLFEHEGPIVLEIGFGMGNSLAQMALDNPGINYIGIEVHKPGVGSLLATIEEQNIPNLRVISHDAVEVLEHSIPNQSLNAIQIFFPDPWPKKRHHKRRLIQAPFVKLLAQKLKTNGQIHIATDWKNYAEWIEEVMAECAEFKRLPHNTPHQRPTTKFEKRGINLGHSVWDLKYVKS